MTSVVIYWQRCYCNEKNGTVEILLEKAGEETDRIKEELQEMGVRKVRKGINSDHG